MRIGTAGWSITARCADAFPRYGSTLERYAARLDAVEINSSFYRPHRPSTYARWRDAVPPDFRFSVKLPREITHDRRLVDTDAPLERFLAEICHLGDKLGALLVQLPPSLPFDDRVALPFFDRLRDRASAPILCEPRHRSWFADGALRALRERLVAIVRADPAPCPEAAALDLDPLFVYLRLHGTPLIYHSSYEPDALQFYARQLLEARGEAWCIFDNTATGAALANALDLVARLERGGSDDP
jgi:uncharacterized protein YecE (DUF72 family)